MSDNHEPFPFEMVRTMDCISKVQRDMQSGVCDFTHNGECSRCGSCCSNFLPISEKEIKDIKRYVRKKEIKEQKRRYPTDTPVVDLTCPFLDTMYKRCLIYEIRPAICRDFRCDKPSKNIHANIELYQGKFRFVDMRDEFFRK